MHCYNYYDTAKTLGSKNIKYYEMKSSYQSAVSSDRVISFYQWKNRRDE